MSENRYLSLIFAGEEQRAPLSFYGPVVRHEYILHYILSGKGYVQCGESPVTVGEGQTFILFPNELAEYYADKDNPWHYIWVNFSGSEADKLIARTAFTPSVRVSPPSPLHEMYPLYRNAVSAYYDRSEPKKEAYLHLLLAHYTEIFPTPKPEEEISAASEIAEYMQNNYRYTRTNIETIASALNISRSQLFRICKSKLGCSPIQYLTDLRLNQARYWLETTEHPIGSIANSVGFDDAMYFSRLFAEKTGVTPTEYRKKFRS